MNPEAAERKARRLLLRLLTKEEREQFERDGYLLVRTARSEYVLSGGGDVSRRRGDYQSACVGLTNDPKDRRPRRHVPLLPPSDVIATYYLGLKANPRQLVNAARWY